MTIYVQYDPSTADASNHVYFSTCSIPDNPDPTKNPPAPQPPLPVLQIAFPDGTNVNGMLLDLSQNPPALIPAG